MELDTIVGPRWGGNGAKGPLTTTFSGAARFGQAHAAYLAAVWEGRVYRYGPGVAALSANTITLTNTTTPIVGIYNPLGSGVNVVPIQAKLAIVSAGNSAVAPGGFVWARSLGNGGLSATLKNPFNAKTLQQAGSAVLGLDTSTPLTGLTNSLVVMEGAAFGSLVVAQGATGTPIVTGGQIEFFDGSLYVPPGGVLALLNTVASTTVSVTAGLLWEEVPEKP